MEVACVFTRDRKDGEQNLRTDKKSAACCISPVIRFVNACEEPLVSERNLAVTEG